MAESTHTTAGSYFDPPETYTTVDVADDVTGLPPRRLADLEIVEGELTL